MDRRIARSINATRVIALGHAVRMRGARGVIVFVIWAGVELLRMGRDGGEMKA